MKRIICILFCIFLLVSQVSAVEKSALAQQIDSFIVQNDLSQDNFALSFFNTATGESYAYNDTKLLPIGEVWTLPLHMYYTLQEHKGAFAPSEDSPEALDPEYEYTINGMNLETCRLESILEGNESVSEAMRDAVPHYMDVINDNFGHLSEAERNSLYYDENCYSARFLMNCMLRITSEPEIYGKLMRTYDMVPQPQGYFASEDSAASKFRTVQLRGEKDGFVCAVAELSTASPYLIVGIVSQEAGGDALLAALNNMIATHVESETTPVPQETGPRETQKDDSIYHVNSSVSDKSSVINIIIIAISIAAAIALAIFLILRLIRHFRSY